VTFLIDVFIASNKLLFNDIFCVPAIMIYESMIGIFFIKSDRKFMKKLILVTKLRTLPKHVTGEQLKMLIIFQEIFIN
jgi:hypothetical protein